jgi:uncharacterized protein (DUF1778 family)
MPLSKRKTHARTQKKLSKRPKKVRLAIECTSLERRHLKMLAASEDKTLNEFILESVRMRLKKCSQSHTPNAKTIKAMQEAEKGEGLIEFDSIEDFFKSLKE